MLYHSVVVLSVFLSACWFVFKRRRQHLPLPPGPPPAWIVGNVKDMTPGVKPWITYSKWCETYKSNIVYVNMLGQGIIILNDRKDAIELFENRNQNYSGRLDNTMVHLMGWEFNIGLMPYGESWRTHRKLFHQKFRKDVMSTYYPDITSKTHAFLRNIMKSPEQFRKHVKTVTSAVAMSVAYGYEITSSEDPFIEMAEEAMAMLSNATSPGAILVNALPILQYLPAWFPGAGFKRFANKCRGLTDQMRDGTFEAVKKKMADGSAKTCLVTDMIEKNMSKVGNEYDESVLRHVAATTYAGAADTSLSAIMSGIYCLASHPLVLQRAQAEIDRVVGKERLPELNDRPYLPYLEAIYREVMRWSPVTPFALPHLSHNDDVYNGYFIPKGTLVTPNIWAMTHDPNVYDAPYEFRPERYYDATGNLNNDDIVLTFGFGRRVCPGRYMAEAQIWYALTCLVSTFNLGPAIDDSGNAIPMAVEYTDTTVSHPKEFSCLIVPRSREAIELVDHTH